MDLACLVKIAFSKKLIKSGPIILSLIYIIRNGNLMLWINATTKSTRIGIQ